MSWRESIEPTGEGRSTKKDFGSYSRKNPPKFLNKTQIQGVASTRNDIFII